MAVTSEEDSARPAADEQTPLLREQSGANGNAVGQADSSEDQPVEEEPSTAKLAIILGSCWVGVFLAAMGQ